MKLLGYNFVLKHIPGKTNHGPDSLSRLHRVDHEGEHRGNCSRELGGAARENGGEGINIRAVKAFMPEPEEWIEEQRKDGEVRKIIDFLNGETEEMTESEKERVEQLTKRYAIVGGILHYVDKEKSNVERDRRTN